MNSTHIKPIYVVNIGYRDADMRVNKMVTLTVEQARYIDESNINLSHLIQKVIQKEMEAKNR